MSLWYSAGPGCLLREGSHPPSGGKPWENSPPTNNSLLPEDSLNGLSPRQAEDSASMGRLRVGVGESLLVEGRHVQMEDHNRPQKVQGQADEADNVAEGRIE